MIVEELGPVMSPSDLTVGLAVATFNQVITDRLLQGALRALQDLGVGEVKIFRVAGAWELPVAALGLAERGCRAVVAIGAMIKGETDHYDVIVRESATGLTLVSIDHGIPIGNAVLAVSDFAQALDRSEPGPGNKGGEAVNAAVAAALSLGL